MSDKYELVLSKRFEKDWKKVQVSRPSAKEQLHEIITYLLAGQSLPTNKRDHALRGNLKGFRDCHVQGDLVLIYKIDKEYNVIRLERIGSHAEIFRM